ncbi:MAG: hypothetical protein GXP22_01580 [Gammaproteobacteria bacterium]|nr:hypothetical protein [Gammaproteobacteria bacterium]
MDRREFFTRSSKKIVKSVADEVADSVRVRAAKWIRPPFALEEIDFLLACTRCNECIDACPHEVIFKLPARLGIQVTATPALDLLNHGCHLCEDWPCVSVCKPGALKIPVKPDDADDESDERFFPRLAIATLDSKHCLPYKGPECGACQGICPVPGAMVWDMTRPVINEKICIGCALCRDACIVEPNAINVRSKYKKLS